MNVKPIRTHLPTADEMASPQSHTCAMRKSCTVRATTTARLRGVTVWSCVADAS